MTNTEIMYEFDFQFTDKSIWVRADVSVQEAMEAIKTGLLKNIPIAKVKMFSITQEETSATFVYDISAAKSGGQPWSLL